MMRWLVVSDDNLTRWNGEYFVHRQWCEFAVRLISQAGEGTLMSHVNDLQSSPAHSLSRLPVGNVAVVESLWSGGFLSAFRNQLFHGSRWQKNTDDVVSRHDVVVHRIPSPYLSYVAKACERFKKPLVLMLSGDLVKQAILPHRLPFPLSSLSRYYIEYENRRQIRIGRGATVVFVHGGVELAEEWASARRVVPWRTGHLTPDMFHRRWDTCQGREVRLIRVCDLSPPRGIDSLLAAFAAIRSQHDNVVLDIVGDGHPAYVAKLKRVSESLGVNDQVRWHGWCNREKVQSLMRSADIQIACPLADGVARVILEGAANCLPLIATRVGGVPLHVEHEQTALLVPAGQPLAIASATNRLMGDAELRRRLINYGYESAQEWTVEKTIGRMIDIIQGELPQQKACRRIAA